MPAGRAPQPAYVEEFDEDAHDIVPDSRHSAHATANTAVKISSRLDQRFPAEPLIDGASDSGYSSRTAATANSTQSGPSGGRSPPVPIKVDMPKQRTELARKNSSRRDRKEKERERVRPEHVEKQMGTHPHQHAHVQRSSSKSRRPDSAHIRHPPPELYYEGSRYYHQQPSTPVERPPMDYQYHFARPPVPDYPPSSPHTSRYGYAVEEFHRASGRPHRSNSYRGGMYHPERPMSMHGGMMGPPPAPMYHHQPHYYEPGPPPASSAYASHQYASSPYGGSYYAGSDYGPPSDYPRERSPSRTREISMQPRARRPSSAFGPPPMDHTVFPDWEEPEPIDHWPPEEFHQEMPREPRRERGVPRDYHREVHPDAPRERASKPARDEDYYRMPPPPPPAPSKHKAQVHQVKRPEPSRRTQTTQAIPSQRRQSRTSMDMSDMVAALPEYSRRVSRETRPERSHSLRDNKRSTSYHDSARGAQVAIESNSRRRRPTTYYYEDGGSTGTAGGLEDREREAEQYQARQSGRTNTMPASAEALLTKSVVGAASDNASQKSRSNSSHASGSGNGESRNMNLTVNGLTIGFSEESVAGQNISIRAGKTGRVQLQIAGERRPKQYLMSGSSYSDQTGRSGRRELEDAPRRSRDDRRADRVSRRSSQSTYGGERDRRYA